MVSREEVAYLERARSAGLMSEAEFQGALGNPGAIPAPYLIRIGERAAEQAARQPSPVQSPSDIQAEAFAAEKRRRIAAGETIEPTATYHPHTQPMFPAGGGGFTRKPPAPPPQKTTAPPTTPVNESSDAALPAGQTQPRETIAPTAANIEGANRTIGSMDTMISTESRTLREREAAVRRRQAELEAAEKEYKSYDSRISGKQFVGFDTHLRRFEGSEEDYLQYKAASTKYEQARGKYEGAYGAYQEQLGKVQPLIDRRNQTAEGLGIAVQEYNATVEFKNRVIGQAQKKAARQESVIEKFNLNPTVAQATILAPLVGEAAGADMLRVGRENAARAEAQNAAVLEYTTNPLAAGKLSGWLQTGVISQTTYNSLLSWSQQQGRDTQAISEFNRAPSAGTFLSMDLAGVSPETTQLIKATATENAERQMRMSGLAEKPTTEADINYAAQLYFAGDVSREEFQAYEGVARSNILADKIARGEPIDLPAGEMVTLGKWGFKLEGYEIRDTLYPNTKVTPFAVGGRIKAYYDVNENQIFEESELKSIQNAESSWSPYPAWTQPARGYSERDQPYLQGSLDIRIAGTYEKDGVIYPKFSVSLREPIEGEDARQIMADVRNRQIQRDFYAEASAIDQAATTAHLVLVVSSLPLSDPSRSGLIERLSARGELVAVRVDYGSESAFFLNEGEASRYYGASEIQPVVAPPAARPGMFGLSADQQGLIGFTASEAMFTLRLDHQQQPEFRRIPRYGGLYNTITEGMQPYSGSRGEIFKQFNENVITGARNILGLHEAGVQMIERDIDIGVRGIENPTIRTVARVGGYTGTEVTRMIGGGTMVVASAVPLIPSAIIARGAGERAAAAISTVGGLTTFGGERKQEFMDDLEKAIGKSVGDIVAFGAIVPGMKAGISKARYAEYDPFSTGRAMKSEPILGTVAKMLSPNSNRPAPAGLTGKMFGTGEIVNIGTTAKPAPTTTIGKMFGASKPKTTAAPLTASEPSVTPTQAGLVKAIKTEPGVIIEDLTESHVRELVNPVFKNMGVNIEKIDIVVTDTKGFVEAGLPADYTGTSYRVHPKNIGLETNQIWINKDYPLSTVVKTVGHEATHIIETRGSQLVAEPHVAEALALKGETKFVNEFNKQYGTEISTEFNIEKLKNTPADAKYYEATKTMEKVKSNIRPEFRYAESPQSSLTGKMFGTGKPKTTATKQTPVSATPEPVILEPYQKTYPEAVGDLPETVYHVTTSKSAIISEGLKPPAKTGKTGLGGSGKENISFTSSLEVAKYIKQTFIESRNPEYSMYDPEIAKIPEGEIAILEFKTKPGIRGAKLENAMDEWVTRSTEGIELTAVVDEPGVTIPKKATTPTTTKMFGAGDIIGKEVTAKPAPASIAGKMFGTGYRESVAGFFGREPATPAKPTFGTPKGRAESVLGKERASLATPRQGIDWKIARGIKDMLSDESAEASMTKKKRKPVQRLESVMEKPKTESEAKVETLDLTELDKMYPKRKQKSIPVIDLTPELKDLYFKKHGLTELTVDNPAPRAVHTVKKYIYKQEPLSDIAKQHNLERQKQEAEANAIQTARRKTKTVQENAFELTPTTVSATDTVSGQKAIAVPVSVAISKTTPVSISKTKAVPVSVASSKSVAISKAVAIPISVAVAKSKAISKAVSIATNKSVAISTTQQKAPQISRNIAISKPITKASNATVSTVSGHSGFVEGIVSKKRYTRLPSANLPTQKKQDKIIGIIPFGGFKSETMYTASFAPDSGEDTFTTPVFTPQREKQDKIIGKIFFDKSPRTTTTPVITTPTLRPPTKTPVIKPPRTPTLRPPRQPPRRPPKKPPREPPIIKLSPSRPDAIFKKTKSKKTKGMKFGETTGVLLPGQMLRGGSKSILKKGKKSKSILKKTKKVRIK